MSKVTRACEQCGKLMFNVDSRKYLCDSCKTRRICAICGETFHVKAHDRFTTECPECRNKRICIDCGNIFVLPNTRYNSKRCPQCGQERKRIKHNEAQQKYRDRDRAITLRKAAKPHSTTKDVIRISKEAQEHGMSYGEYVRALGL